VRSMERSPLLRGASRAFIYIRPNTTPVDPNLARAIEQAQRHRLLGQRLFRSSFEFHGGVCGRAGHVLRNETGLIHIDRRQARHPQPTAAYRPSSGWRLPTLINNVETFATCAESCGRFPDGNARDRTPAAKHQVSHDGNVRWGGLLESARIGQQPGQHRAEMGRVLPKAPRSSRPDVAPRVAACRFRAQHQRSKLRLSLQTGHESWLRAWWEMATAPNIGALAAFFMEFCRIIPAASACPCRAGTSPATMVCCRKHLAATPPGPRDLAQLEAPSTMVKTQPLRPRRALPTGPEHPAPLP